MISILFNWVYILVTTFIAGEFFLNRFYTCIKYKKNLSICTCIVCGIAINTAYAGYFSLFGGVNIVANIILIGVCILFAWIDRKKYKEIFSDVCFSKSKMVCWLLCLIGIVVIAYFCSNTNFMYDTGLYHAQSIRWNEEYGAVKGITNIHERFGYNSSFFLFCALYSMKDLFGQSLHAGQGFIAAIICVYSLSGLFNHFSRKYLVSNICRLAPAIYTLIILCEIISPTTDYPTVYLIMWIVIEHTTMSENGSTGKDRKFYYMQYALLAIIAVFIVSLKLTAAGMVLIAVYPIYYMIKDKNWKAIWICVTIGLLLILPYFIRNIILSGWLVYPFAAIDLFNVDWKIPVATVIGDATDIKVYARYQYDRTLVNQTIFQWFPTWWNGQRELERFFSAAALISVVPGIFYILVKAFRKKKDRDIPFMIIDGVMIINLFFWLLTSPLHRYGYAFVITVPLLIIGISIDAFWDNWIERILVVLCTFGISVLIIYPVYKILWDDYYLMKGLITDSTYIIMQKDYPTTEMDATDLNGITIYYPKEAGGQSWYQDFPATNFGENIQYWENRGEKIEDGFRNKGL